ncbi:uncharacterized protein LOC123988477 [Osmia bicornis bicornis]|uniref:uncharacterized protein LOC123988477 n=1 Tax=Osmia bicornis bicornis TaxID=1437191 RepID=UPI001EAE9F27|nr:uncharacterized protein LOC123988477 [Osmia bicornis bicornis]
MATAIILVMDRDQKPIECRTLIDTCSNANFITEDLASKLRLPAKQHTTTIEALNQLSTVTTQIVSTSIKSRLSNFKRTLTFITIPRISGPIPDQQIDRGKIPIPANINLADPHFHRPTSVDMLLGIGTALACLSVGQIDISPSNKTDLILQKTLFGWIIGGSLSTSMTRHKVFLTTPNFDLKKFWELEEGPQVRYLSAEEQECEEHFRNHTKRDKSGRYIVALPFNEKYTQLGESRSRALNRFLSLERKFNREPELKCEYANVIQEYQDLGHMSEVQPNERDGFYLPHHAVIKLSSATTKVRVVFDGSAKTSSGLSLNDTLMVGPTIQDDIVLLLIRFRMHAYVLTGDIEKMYRQFLVRPEDRRYQRILWRNDDGKVKTYNLNTVTFGLTSAPYLAIRCLHQLADDEGNGNPAAARVIKQDLYVDDLLTGADTCEEAMTLRDGIIDILKRGGLNIRQWASNEPQLLSGLDEAQISKKFLGDSTLKTLGVIWDAQNDKILYTIDPIVTNRVTKRTILSSIAKIFDPLGLLAPVIIKAKILMQRLWQLQLDWDEATPANLHTEWITFAAEFNLLNNCSFDRHVLQHGVSKTELHGFCDASERAYGACIYVRTVTKSGNIKTELLCAKSRVAPLKTVSLARLELCGAVLLSFLYKTVTKATSRNFDTSTFWTDSTIVLNWINKEPSTLKTFVANRVTEVQSKTDINAWKHVKSADNPADLISRGQSPSQFLADSIWRHGPQWLASDDSTWPESKFAIMPETLETRPLACFATTVNQDDQILSRYSCIKKLRRIVAYCLRFRATPKHKGPLSIEEIRNANERIIKMVQSSSFTQEIKELGNKSGLQSSSKLLPLHPFLDERGILRVGGRLQNSTIPFEEKHPILLPKNHHVVDLIVRNAHLEGYHLGINSTLYTVRQQYWPIDGKNTVRKVIRRCIRCFRFNPPATKYIMGNLPAPRVSESRPFSNCGIDYCGPFYTV